MTYGKEDEELPLWSGKVEDFEIWKMRLQALKHSTEDGKKKTCAPKIYSKMINESNFAKYEKYLHEIELDRLRQDDGVDYLYEYFKTRAGVNEIQEIGGVIDKYFRIERKQEETIGSYELREVRAHEELARIMTALNNQQARADAEAAFVAAPAGQGVATPEVQRAAFVQAAVDAVNRQEMPSIFRGWMFLKNSLFTSNEKSHIRSLTRGKLGLSTVVDTLKEIWPEDELRTRDKQKKNSAQQGKQVLATLQQVREGYEEQRQYDDWTSDVYYDQGYHDHEGYYHDEHYEEYEQDEDEDDEEESDEVDADNESELDVRIEDHVNNNMESRSFEVAHKEKLTNKKSRHFYDNHQCYNCFQYGHLSRDCPYAQQEEDGSYWNHGWYDAGWSYVNFDIWNNQGEKKNPQHMKRLLHEIRGEAVLDCGATRCVAGVDALDDLQTELMKEGTSIRINSEERHRVRFGDNKTLTTTGTVYVPWRHGGVDVEIAIGVLPNSPMPILLSKNVLKDMEMVTDFGKNQITTPQLRDEGRYLKVCESCTGHMLMPMTKKSWNADLKDKHTELIYVNVPGDKKMNTKSAIDMDPGVVIGGQLEMATTKYIDAGDHEKEEIDKAKTTFERIRPADICH